MQGQGEEQHTASNASMQPRPKMKSFVNIFVLNKRLPRSNWNSHRLTRDPDIQEVDEVNEAGVKVQRGMSGEELEDFEVLWQQLTPSTPFHRPIYTDHKPVS